ncbi:ketoacyl-ACP synthase III [Streptomyces sp. NPDC059853]|uniref:ketoacyl-ACP synthase III n=1 Tax=Streptomyces sp. NPDC059853 TaxID=3346973 RepID=UPI00365A43CD
MDTPLWRGSGLRFTGFGHYYPRTHVRNEATEEVAGNAVDAAVIGRIEVRGRHVAEEDETVPEMARLAAADALADAGLEPGDIDLLILSNWTDRQFVPEHAPTAARLLGADRALAFDVCGACTGFVHGTQLAAALLKTTPHWTNALVVGADRFSRRVRPGSKGGLIVGDAAGAAVLTRGEPDPAGRGLVDSLLISDGDGAGTVTVLPPNGWIKSDPKLVDIAVGAHETVAGTLLPRSGVKMADVDWVVPHPGTGPMHSRIREQLEIPEDRFVTNFEERGNTGSASIPIVLSEMAKDGRLRPGQLVLTPTVGSGWFYGGLLFHA